MICFENTKNLECPICKHGRSINLKEKDILLSPPDNWNFLVNCPHCNQNSKLCDLIIQAVVSENIFQIYSLLSDIEIAGEIELEIGVPYEVALADNVPFIHKIFLTPLGKPSCVAPIFHNNSRSFTIVSSEVPNYSRVKDKQCLSWSLYGSSTEINDKVWQNILLAAKEELLAGQYNLSLLTSAIAFESFICLMLRIIFKSENMSKTKIDSFFEKTKEINKKIAYLLNKINKSDLEREKLDAWLKLFRERNDVAHGSKFDTSKREALDAFSVAVKGIFFFIMNTNFALLQFQPQD